MVAKRQGREKPAKIEKRKVRQRTGVRTSGRTALLLGPVYIGQAQGREKTYKKRVQRAGGGCLSPLHARPFSLSFLFWVRMPSLLEDVFSFVF